MVCKKHGIEMQLVTHGPAYNIKNSYLIGGDFYYCEKCDNERRVRTVEEEEAELEKKILAGIPIRFSNARISDFKNIDKINKWLQKPDSFLFIHGKCGCGKTHLLCAIKRFFNSKDTASELEFSSNLFLELRNSFNQGGQTERGIISCYTRKKIFLFDDLGAQKLSEYAIESWYSIIDTRYREMLPTVFTSNFSLKEIASKMSDRIASRLASGTIFELRGEDKRIATRQIWQ